MVREKKHLLLRNCAINLFDVSELMKTTTTTKAEKKLTAVVTAAAESQVFSSHEIWS